MLETDTIAHHIWGERNGYKVRWASGSTSTSAVHPSLLPTLSTFKYSLYEKSTIGRTRISFQNAVYHRPYHLHCDPGLRRGRHAAEDSIPRSPQAPGRHLPRHRCSAVLSARCRRRGQLVLEVAGDVADLASLEAACAESGLSAQCCTLVVVSCDPSLVSTPSIGGVRVWINIAFLVHPTPPHSYPVSASIVATFPWLADVCPPVHAGAHEDSRVGRFTGVGPPKDAVGHVNEQANMFFFVLQGTDALLCSDV